MEPHINNSHSAQEHAYRTIRKQLISGALVPGSQVSQLKLSRSLGISRGPIREAINRLTGEGLLTHHPSGGTLVPEPNRQDIDDLFQLRDWLECAVIEEVIRRITPKELDALQTLLDEMRSIVREAGDAGSQYLTDEQDQRFGLIDVAFHVRLMRATGNQRLTKFFADQLLFFGLYCFVAEKLEFRSAAKKYQEHTRIYRAIRRRDPRLALELMQYHLRTGREHALDLFDELQDAREELPSDWIPAIVSDIEEIEKDLDP